MNVLIVGAGIFGCSIAHELSKNKINVTIVDSNSDIMLNASKNNHNRLHLGFHYPRSKETAADLVVFRKYYPPAGQKRDYSFQ